MYQVPVPAKPWTPVWPLNDSRLGSNIVQAYLKCQIPAYVMDVKPSITRIQSVVCREMDVEIIDMTSDRRTQKPTLARQIAMYLVRTMTHRSMPEIGRRFGGRDHTTVLHAFRKIGERRKCDPELDQLITNLANLIGCR